MSALTYNNWNNFITGASLQAFEAVILQSPLLTNLLNAFGGTVSLSNGEETYYSQASNTIFIGTDYASGSLAALAVALAHELGHAEVDGGNPATLLSAPSVSAGIQVGLHAEGVAVATEFVVASQLRHNHGAIGGVRRQYGQFWKHRCRHQQHHLRRQWH